MYTRIQPKNGGRFSCFAAVSRRLIAFSTDALASDLAGDAKGIFGARYNDVRSGVPWKLP